ncbi:MAG: hypothetical protein HY560_09020, partial [Gemmatimonadetes bacterium]|nr:hypothetical protein [Gemmatimonadota bacterium]
RGLVTLVALGAAGFVGWQLLWVFVLPFVFGFFALLLKIVFWAVVIWLAIWLFRKVTRPTLTVS